MVVEFCIPSTIQFYSHCRSFTCLFPSKKWLFISLWAAFELVITDLNGKIYWLVFSLLFGIVHVQLVSADVFWTELGTSKTLQISSVLQGSTLIRAASHKIHMSCARSGCTPCLQYNLHLTVNMFSHTSRVSKRVFDIDAGMAFLMWKPWFQISCVFHSQTKHAFICSWTFHKLFFLKL